MAIASDQLEVATDDLEIAGSQVQVRGTPRPQYRAGPDRRAQHGRERQVSARLRPGPLRASPSAPRASPPTSPASGWTLTPTEPQVIGYVAIQDVGKAINPAGFEDQIHGGVAQGIGWALYEGIVLDDDGRVHDRQLARLRPALGRQGAA